jgi:tetratricopeptide (TPR) repeat protein
VLRLVALAFLVGIFAWALWGSDRARVAEAHWTKVLAAEHFLQADEWQGSDPAFEYLFSHAEAAAATEPDNIHYRHWLGVYRWLSLTPYIDPNTGQLPPEALDWAREIVADLHQARPLCPTFGPICCVAGEIEKFVLNDPNGAERIRQGYRLAPCDSTACLAVARIEAEAGDVESAFGKITRAVQLDRGRFWQAAAFCMDTLARPDLALQLAGDNIEWLSHVANKLLAAGVPSQFVDAARAKALERLEQKSREPGAPARVLVSLAHLYSQRGDVELGIDRYRLALMKDYGQVSVHLELARLLKQAGRTGEELHEAQICLRLSPDLAPAKRLVEELSVLPLDAADPPQAAGQ